MNQRRLLLTVNAGVLVLAGLGFVLEHVTGLTFLRAISTTIVAVLLLGLNVSFFLLPAQKRTLIDYLSFGFFVSLIGSATVLYLLMLLGGQRLTESLALETLGALWLGSFVVGLLPKRTIEPLTQAEWRILLGSLGLFLIVLGGIFLVYPYIPEADPYVFLRFAQQTIQTGHYLAGAYRPLFTVMLSELFVASHLSLIVIFKYLIPILFGTILLPIFLIARHYLRPSWLIGLATVVPVTVPVVLLEGEVTRPQTIILFLLPVSLYFLEQAIRVRSYSLLGLVTLVAILATRVHEFAIYLLVACLVSFFLIAWQDVRRQPRLSLLIGLLGFLAIYPYTKDLLAGAVLQAAHTVFETLKHPQFRWWFLSNYTNIDGQSVGWSGWSWLLYYGYNFGLVVPVLIFVILASMKKKNPTNQLRDWLPTLPAIVLTILLIVVAEVLPRFGLYFFPDRAWPFLILSLSFWLPLVLRIFNDRPVTIRFRKTLFLIVLISVGSSVAIAAAKQGWTTRAEYQASQFLKNSTPVNSRVIAQGTAGFTVEIYGERYYSNIDIFANDLSPSQRWQRTQSQPPQPVLDPKVLLKEQADILTELDQETTLLPSYTPQEAAGEEAKRSGLVSRYFEIQALLSQQAASPVPTGPVYIMYSLDKFRFLYGGRPWWRELNYANADLSVFDNPTIYEKVFDNGPVKIWRVKGT